VCLKDRDTSRKVSGRRIQIVFLPYSPPSSLPCIVSQHSFCWSFSSNGGSVEPPLFMVRSGKWAVLFTIDRFPMLPQPLSLHLHFAYHRLGAATPLGNSRLASVACICSLSRRSLSHKARSSSVRYAAHFQKRSNSRLFLVAV